MNNDVTKDEKYETIMDNFTSGKCTECQKSIRMADFVDRASITEYKISGMCQDCQDIIYD